MRYKVVLRHTPPQLYPFLRDSAWLGVLGESAAEFLIAMDTMGTRQNPNLDSAGSVSLGNAIVLCMASLDWNPETRR